MLSARRNAPRGAAAAAVRQLRTWDCGTGCDASRLLLVQRNRLRGAQILLRTGAKLQKTLGHLEQWSILTPDWGPSSGWVLRSIDCRLHGFPFSARCFGWNTADDSITFMPRRAVLASPGGECCRPGSVSRSWRAPAPCRSFARSDRPARSAATRTHARCERVSGSWRGSLALAPKRAHGCADRVDESGCCNRWP